jgi:hypothetical protein
LRGGAKVRKHKRWKHDRFGNALSLYCITLFCRAIACCAVMLGAAEGGAAADAAGSAAAAAAGRSASARPQCSQHALAAAAANGLCMEKRTVGVDGSSAFAAGATTPFSEVASAAGSEIGAGRLVLASALVDIVRRAYRNSSRLYFLLERRKSPTTAWEKSRNSYRIPLQKYSKSVPATTAVAHFTGKTNSAAVKSIW